MTRQSPPELYAQRPVRSDFARRGSGGSGGGGRGPNMRKVFLLLGVALVALIGGYALSTMNAEQNATSGEIPTVGAEGPLKERPEQPGGIDIPHQDVAVFQQLDNKGQPAAGKANVEHLLPEPETPNEQAITNAVTQADANVAPAPSASPTPAPVEPVSAKTESVLDQPKAEVPPAVTEAAPEPSPVTPAVVEKTAEPKTIEKAKTTKAVEPKKTEATKAKEPPAKATVKAPAKTATEDSKKADAAMAKLPKELFTSDDPSATVASTPPVESTTKTEAVAEPPKATEAPAPSGSRSLQLASVGDESSANKEAAKLQSKYAGLLGGASLRVVKADLGAKGIYYRVTSSPMDAAKAKSICNSITQQNGKCILVK